MNDPIYKIATQEDWQKAQSCGTYQGSIHDLRDGFIHFSTASQLIATANKHFATQDNLFLVSVDPNQFGDDLRWESSRGGDLFPHLYSPLAINQVTAIRPLQRSSDGTLFLPEGQAL